MPSRSRISRYHDFSYGHRVAGHEGSCALIHGHNGRATFVCEGKLDKVGRVIDFHVVKDLLCEWLEKHWDHRFLAWHDDSVIKTINERMVDSYATDNTVLNAWDVWRRSIVYVPFNPTAENMADYLLTVIAPHQLMGTGVTCVRVVVEETRKCAAAADLVR